MVVETQRALVYLHLRVYGTKNSLALAHPHVQEQTCHGAANTGWCHWTPEHDLDFNVASGVRATSVWSPVCDHGTLTTKLIIRKGC